jgi:nitrate reductase gamma subunit
LFAVLFRHLRFFTEPILRPVLFWQQIDGLFESAVPAFYMSGALFLTGGAYLAARRLFDDKIRYLSFFSDYFFIFLLLGIGITGVLLRYVFKTDVVAVKTFTMGIVSFAPVCPENISPLFFSHLFLVSVLLCAFPFSKLVHGMGLLFSPAKNMRACSRAIRHVNPWNDPSVKPRSYADYEDEFRDKMKAAGIPVEKE